MPNFLFSFFPTMLILGSLDGKQPVGTNENAMSRDVHQSAVGTDHQFVEVEIGNDSLATGNSTDSSVSSLEVEHQEDHKATSFLENSARRMARNPCQHLVIALVLSVAVSAAGFIFGEFSVSADQNGWFSRGTSIADQTTQLLLLDGYDGKLNDNPDVWNDLTSNVQMGFKAENEDRRRLQIINPDMVDDASYDRFGFLACEATNFYLNNNEFLRSPGTHLWPAWKARKDDVSLFDPKAVRDICEAEKITQKVLEERNLCGGCGSECFPPLSVVLVARYYLGDLKEQFSCEELADNWTFVRANVEAQLLESAEAVRAGNFSITMSPIAALIPFLVDDQFAVDGSTFVKYSTSIFSTAWANTTRGDVVNELNDLRGTYDRGENSEVVEGVYDTRNEDFLKIDMDEALIRDMWLASASALVTAVAILIHTRSPWITLIGLAQIIISFPLAYFFYNIILRLTFFPFLNFIGVFVTFALGADDVFVACDKWKNARLDHPDANIEYIAAKALPDAAKAMFLTTITTAAAFFATAICPTTALKMFAIFLGLLIIFDYILCAILVFPALCLYDRWSHQRCCVSFNWCKSNGDGERTESLIRRILSAYYGFIHRFRYILVVVIVVTTVLCCIIATRLGLPATSDVRLLNESHELERVFRWKFNLFAAYLERRKGSRVWHAWGLTPADTGNHNDPAESSAFVLDDSFDPAPEENQIYLRNFCVEFFQQDYAIPVYEHICAMLKFESWLERESKRPVLKVAYAENCGGATSVPVAEENFHACMIGFTQDQSPDGVYYVDGKVKIMRIQYRHIGVAYDSAFNALDSAWNKLSAFLEDQNSKAPVGVDKAFASSADFWWYDTNGSILSTAYGAISIALAAAFIVVLLSSRSIEITLFAIFTIGFILASVTALLVLSGWTLGFLESVCFAILIGMSCDFVLHFGHAYSSHPGDVSRHERTKDALIKMGPSILAAAVTTIASAVVMMFTSIVFFQRFAVILFYSLLMGLVGSAFVFLVLTDTFGPNEPTVFIDSLFRFTIPSERSGDPRKSSRARQRPPLLQIPQPNSDGENSSHEPSSENSNVRPEVCA